MTDRAAKLVATLRALPTAPGIAPQTVVALPPSDEDAAVGSMRVVVNGVVTSRQFDPVLEQP